MEISLLVIGAIIGVLADVLFRQLILRFILKSRRTIAHLLKRSDPLVDRPHQLRFGNVITDWVSLYGTGELPLHFRYLHAELSDEYVTLPDDLHKLREKNRRELERKAKETKGAIWNGECFALTKFYPTRYGRKEDLRS